MSTDFLATFRLYYKKHLRDLSIEMMFTRKLKLIPFYQKLIIKCYISKGLS